MEKKIKPEPDVFVKQSLSYGQAHTEFVLHSNLNSQKICMGADGTFFSIHVLFIFSLLAIPCLKTSPALLSPSLFVLSKSACLPLKPPLLPCL